MNAAEALSLPDLRRELPRVDEALLEAVASENSQLKDVAGHLIKAGGKRLRPMICVAAALTANDGAPAADDVIAGAAAVELVHLGSLYHDDVLDGAKTRRNVESVNARWDNFTAIIAGDYLLARASGIAARLGTQITAILANTIADLCEGQVLEHQYAFDPSRDAEAYERCISGKTASLLASATRIGALTAGMETSRVEALTRFGHAFGMAFQIRDDILDVVGTEEQLGKPAGNDLVEGVYTLPVIYALASAVSGPELKSLLGSKIEPEVRDRAQDIVKASPAVEMARNSGERWASAASDALDKAEVAGPVAEQLRSLTKGLFTDLDG